MSNDAQRDFWRAQLNWVRMHEDSDAVLRALDPVVLAPLVPGMRVLEIGCGAGGTTRRILEAVSPGGAAAAVDISEPFVEAARARVPGAEIRVADAQSADLGGPYDACVSRLGTMFFEDTQSAFANIRRALEPGAPIAFLAWGPAEENPHFAMPRRVATQALGPLDVSRPGAPGPFGFADPAKPRRAAESAGFSDVAVERVAATLSHPEGVPGYARVMMAIGPVVGAMRERGASEAQRAAIAARIAEELEAMGGRVPALMHLVTARA